LSFHAALARQQLSGEPRGGWFPGERLSLAEIIHAFTQVPAWVSRKEDQLGILAPGRKADLVVFDRDLFALAPDQISSAEVELTVVDGEVVYRRGETSSGS
ncbi:MAG TPA: amidohydrolase family protein, partial [Candidatus Methylomirabilis sp.]|nr:amidohydrolase family protein [Candidatus Methylomirabilis sp.]